MLKLELRDVRLDQSLRYYRTGSILGGTIECGLRAVDVAIEIDSDEPPEKIARLVDVATRSCFTHGALARPVEIATTVRLNGEPLDSNGG
jgi:hypothetical protein